MRVLYGVCGEGMGHAIRSGIVGAYLEQSLGHEVTFLSSGPAQAYLQERSPRPVLSAAGLRFESDESGVRLLDTALSNAARQIGAALTELGATAKVMSRPPDVVLTDFEPAASRMALLTGAPLVSLDNIHALTRCPSFCPPSARFVISAVAPQANRYLVTSLDPSLVSTAPRTSMHLPIIRPEIMRLSNRQDGSIVGYVTRAGSSAGLVRAAVYVGLCMRLYDASATEPSQVGPVSILPVSNAFDQDLSRARAVIASAGFTLLSECAYLGKPVLALPVRNQAEQEHNADAVSRLGWGAASRDVTADVLRDFLRNVPAYEQNLSRYRHDDNRELLSSVGRALQEVQTPKRLRWLLS